MPQFLKTVIQCLKLNNKVTTRSGSFSNLVLYGGTMWLFYKQSHDFTVVNCAALCKANEYPFAPIPQITAQATSDKYE